MHILHSLRYPVTFSQHELDVIPSFLFAFKIRHHFPAISHYTADVTGFSQRVFLFDAPDLKPGTMVIRVLVSDLFIHCDFDNAVVKNAGPSVAI